MARRPPDGTISRPFIKREANRFGRFYDSPVPSEQAARMGIPLDSLAGHLYVDW
jgi:hypothetical protein